MSRRREATAEEMHTLKSGPVSFSVDDFVATHEPMRLSALGRGRYAKTQKLADEIEAIFAEFDGVMSTRQVFYQAVSRGAVQNTNAAYGRVQRLLVDLRKDRTIDYDRVVDRTRAKHQIATWASCADMLRACSTQFRRNAWAEMSTVVMIGLEKQALEGVFGEVVDEFGAALWVCRGYPSDAFAFEWATEITECTDAGKRVIVYYFGDHDPSGLDIERTCIVKLKEHDAEFEWQRAGLLAEDFGAHGLVKLPVKRSDTRSAQYLIEHGEWGAELDALPPAELDRRIRECIEEHVNLDLLARIRREDEIEREGFKVISGNWKGALAGAKGGPAA